MLIMPSNLRLYSTGVMGFLSHYRGACLLGPRKTRRADVPEGDLLRLGVELSCFCLFYRVQAIGGLGNRLPVTANKALIPKRKQRLEARIAVFCRKVDVSY